MTTRDPNIARCDSRARRPELYRAAHQTSAEHQVQAFLETLIRLTNPRHVLEVGLARGETSVRLIRALQTANGPIGTYTGVDIAAEACGRVRARTADSDVDVTVVAKPFDQYRPADDRLFDLVFIDADWLNRCAEYQHARTMTTPGGLIVMHDTGDASPGRQDALCGPKNAGDPMIDIACPRGIILAQVPWS